jgi:hypothetical protein
VAIKAGQILHIGGGTIVIDRIQTGGPGQLNIPTTRIFELGNYESVAVVRDRPDLSFTLNSLDVSLEIEQFLTKNLVSATTVDMSTVTPVNITTAFKPGIDMPSPYDIVASVSMPWLTVESISYRFGLTDNASQEVTLRGSEIYYNPNSTFVQEYTGTNTANQVCSTAHTAYVYNAEDLPRAALCVSLNGRKLTYGTDYTEARGTLTAGAGTLTVTVLAAVPVTEKITITYASPFLTNYPQSVHPLATVKPAAVRGKDINVYVGGTGFNPADIPGSKVNRWDGVQAVTLDWRQTLEADEEFGNPNVVSYDPTDVPDLSGTIEVRPSDVANFYKKLRQATGTATATEVIGPNSVVPLSLDVVINHPDTKQPIKWFQIDDARILPPGFQGQVQQKTNVTFNWTSDTGKLLVNKLGA